MSEPFTKLAAKLSELFELEKADLDFGIHRIIKARQKHIRTFLGLDPPPADDPHAPTLQKIVRREMGELNTVELERQLSAATEKITDNYGKLAFAGGGALADGAAKESPDGQTWLSLREQLDSGAEQTNARLEAEIYSHLTEFFSRYYDEADFLSKRRIKAGDSPYAVPYSGEEVMLHWANKDQYYIKSSKDLKDYTFTLPESFGDKRVHFKCERQDPVLNNNNAKREFHLDDEAEIQIGADFLVIPFHFRIVEKTRTQPETKAWIETLLAKLPIDWQQALKHIPAEAKNNLITRHLANYTRKNEADFFIHKHLGKFLRGELDFYIKNEVMHLDDIDSKSTDYLATRVRLIKALRTIARHIITFLAQLENFQKKLWLKKKYVTETQYCLTLDRIFAMPKAGELIAAITTHLATQIRRYDGEMRSQTDEWIKLYAIHELPDFPKNGKLTPAFLQAHDKLMLDTVFFPSSLKWQLLANIDDLDASLDGLVIHSENFQALNLLQERYRERVAHVFTDPPYNTGVDGFPYKDSYQHSSWVSYIFDRFAVLQGMMEQKGILLVTIDFVEVANLRIILDNVFGSAQFLADIAWEKRYTRSNNAKKFYSLKDTIMVYRASPFLDTIKEKRTESSKNNYTNPDNDARGPWISSSYVNPATKDERPNLVYSIRNPITGVYVNHPTHAWKYDRRTHEKHLAEKRLFWGVEGNYELPRLKSFLSDASEEMVPVDFWKHQETGTTDDGGTQLKVLFGAQVFDNPKPPSLVEKTLDLITGSVASLTCDPFAGSGTTGHAVINLNREDGGTRKYILVEMGDHFDTVLKPRLQKVVYSKDWKEGKPTAPETGISHAFKYLRLESYEDALNNLDLGHDRAPDLLGLGDQVREDYLFSYLLDVETRGHLLNLERFRDPWGCQLKIHDPHTGKSEPRAIDLVETFNYLLGITVREVRTHGKDGGFLTIEGESPSGDTILIIWRKLEGESEWPTTTNEDLKTFAKEKLRLNPADTEYHAIYLNGDHTLEDPHSKIHCIEEVFYERMFENTGNPED